MSSVYEEARLMLYCQEVLSDAVERSKLSRTEIAKRIGKNRSFITQALSSGRNLTITSMAKLAWAAGYRINVRIAPIQKRRTRKPPC